MTLYSIEQQQFGLAKESTRGTAITAPTKWYPTRGKADFDYMLKKLKDTGIRGAATEYPDIPGVKDGHGKVPMILDPQMIGEFLNSCLGSVSSAQQASTAAYKHTFVRAATIQKPSYTFFVDRGLNVMGYNRGTVKKLSFKGGVDNLIDVDADVIVQSEASNSIGSPSYPVQQYQSFQNVTFNIAGSQSLDVKEWSLSIDNGAKEYRTLANSQDLTDIVAPGKLQIEGGFTIYFTSATERAKFLANTAVALEINASGAVIASTYHYGVDINIYKALYKAFPYGDDQGLLAAKVTFQGFYDSVSGKDIQFDVTNTDTAY